MRLLKITINTGAHLPTGFEILYFSPQPYQQRNLLCHIISQGTNISSLRVTIPFTPLQILDFLLLHFCIQIIIICLHFAHEVRKNFYIYAVHSPTLRPTRLPSESGALPVPPPGDDAGDPPAYPASEQ